MCYVVAVSLFYFYNIKSVKAETVPHLLLYLDCLAQYWTHKGNPGTLRNEEEPVFSLLEPTLPASSVQDSPSHPASAFTSGSVCSFWFLKSFLLQAEWHLCARILFFNTSKVPKNFFIFLPSLTMV